MWKRNNSVLLTRALAMTAIRLYGPSVSTKPSPAPLPFTAQATTPLSHVIVCVFVSADAAKLYFVGGTSVTVPPRSTVPDFVCILVLPWHHGAHVFIMMAASNQFEGQE